MKFYLNPKTLNLQVMFDHGIFFKSGLGLGWFFFNKLHGFKWVVVKIRVFFWVPIIIRHPLFRAPKNGP